MELKTIPSRVDLVRVVLSLAVVILLITLLFRKQPPIPDTNGNQVIIEQLQKQVDSLNKVNYLLQEKERTLNNILIEYTKKVDNLTGRLTKLRQEYNEILKHIDNYSNSDLERFFTDRYSRYYGN